MSKTNDGFYTCVYDFGSSGKLENTVLMDYIGNSLLYFDMPFRHSCIFRGFTILRIYILLYIYIKK